MPTRPAISIITPTYNRRSALERAIRSVQEQTFGDYEHLIVDDCSQDGTDPFLQTLSDPRIRSVRFEHWRGANVARNAGIEMARADWLTFLDSDDEFLPHRLAATASATADSPSCQLFISSFQTMKRGRPRPAVNPGLYLSPQELEHALVGHGIFIAGSCITVRRKTLVRAGSFDPAIRRMQDREVLLRLSRTVGAKLLQDVDWVKHPSPNSISGARSGYVAALGYMLAALPELNEHYRPVIGYHVARRVLADLLAGRWRQVVESLSENRAAPALDFNLSDLVRCYLTGSAHRRALAAQLARRDRRPYVVLPDRAWPSTGSYQPAALARAA